MAHNHNTGVWKTVGTFCSWECAKAWNWDAGNGYRSGIRSELLTLLRKRTVQKLSHIAPAPPRACLKVFGGSMTIEEFRAQSSNGIIVDVLPEKMIPMEHIVHARRIEMHKRASTKGPNLEESVDFAGAVQKNETLRLKRPKPMPSSSDVLARTMGLEIS